MNALNANALQAEVTRLRAELADVRRDNAARLAGSDRRADAEEALRIGAVEAAHAEGLKLMAERDALLTQLDTAQGRVRELEAALQEAAASLETISKWTGASDEDYSDKFFDVRGYAGSRASVARNALGPPASPGTGGLPTWPPSKGDVWKWTGGEADGSEWEMDGINTHNAAHSIEVGGPRTIAWRDYEFTDGTLTPVRRGTGRSGEP